MIPCDNDVCKRSIFGLWGAGSSWYELGAAQARSRHRLPSPPHVVAQERSNGSFGSPSNVLPRNIKSWKGFSLVDVILEELKAEFLISRRLSVCFRASCARFFGQKRDDSP
jgi:hypothetical protein